MIKSIPSQVWAFDCEWVPDPVAGRVVYNLPESLSDAGVLKEMWKRGGATEDEPQPFLKLIVSRVVSISVLMRRVEDNNVTLELRSLPSEKTEHHEAAIISRFLHGVGKQQPQLVGFNSIDADLQILVQRGLSHGISVPEFAKRPNKPWEGVDYFAKAGDSHLDLKNMLGSWGKGNPSLHELAVVSGIPGKLGVDGKEVVKLWGEGRLDSIIAYNECDAITTYLLWLRLVRFSGLLTKEGYEEEEQRVRVLLQSLEGAHLELYLKTWDALKQIADSRAVHA